MTHLSQADGVAGQEGFQGGCGGDRAHTRLWPCLIGPRGSVGPGFSEAGNLNFSMNPSHFKMLTVNSIFLKSCKKNFKKVPCGHRTH